ncbi:recombinase family protein [Nocardia goodfellowii]
MSMSMPAFVGSEGAELLGIGGSAPVPVAVFLRTSTRDLQDPTLSLPRQLDNCRKVLPPGFVIVAFFYDVESSRKDLELRGLGNAHEAFDIPIPRDGGLADLLAEARHPNRRFEAVVVEEIERAARWTRQSTQLEHELETVGIPLFAADEGPISLSEKRATQILVRRVKQGVAEWFLRHTLEQSWEGFREHTKQGWNIGKPCHGYLNEKLPHPVAAKREEGRTKSRLVVDPDRAPAVVRIYQLRHDEKLAYRVISDQLNTDPDRYPPPQPNSGTRARGRWTPSSVREILINPKYTGYMVWNRRASKKGGALNPPEKWVWSPQPTHEPLVTREMWEAVQQNRTTRQGSRMNPRNTHPDTHRTYVLRYYVHHKQCNKRMFGKTRKHYGYYTCQPKLDLVGKPEEYTDHPRSVYVREDALLECLEKFFNERVFGPDRTTLLRHQLRGHASGDRHDTEQRITAIEKSLTEIARRQDNLLDERESRPITSGDELADAWAERLRHRFAELEQQRRTKHAELETLRQQAARHQPDEPDLIHELPRLALRLTTAPDILQRDLYEAFGIKIVYDHTTRHATISATLTAETLPAAMTAAAAVSPTAPPEPPGARATTTQEPADVPPPESGGGTAENGTTWATPPVAHVLRAPGRIRTCDAALGERETSDCPG